jgi:hypothetical protein
MPVAVSLGFCMSQHEDSNSGTNSMKVTKNINSIKPSCVKVREYLLDRISSNVSLMFTIPKCLRYKLKEKGSHPSNTTVF